MLLPGCSDPHEEWDEEEGPGARSWSEASQSFGLINLMTEGGPGESSTVLSYYVYLNGFRFYQFGYASASAVVTLAVITVLVVLLRRLLRREAVAF